MSKKMILGIATGVAAVVAIGLIVKKTGALDSIMKKLSNLTDSLDDEFSVSDSLSSMVLPSGEENNGLKAKNN